MTTALTSPARAATGRPAPAPRQLRWLLRLHRPALYLWTALVLVTGAALLWLHGPLTDAAAAAWTQYDACGFASSEPCAYDQDAILRYKDVYTYTTAAVLAVPFLVAAWAGGVLSGRELESGTARLAWTQSVSPARWLAARLALPAALVTAGSGLLVLLHHLAWTAGEGRIDTAKPWYDSPTFHANGPTTVALALAGLFAGALAGLVLRRTLAALATAAVAVAALWTAVHLSLPRLWPTVTHVSSLKHGPSGTGITVAEGLVTSTGARLPDASCGSGLIPECDAAYARMDAVGFYREYHPQSHYWPLHLMATGVLLAVTALLALAAFRLLRHRTTAPVRTREKAAV
ncbi:hypothetical protein GCM10027074_41470 [Streptomyces deserti]